MQNQIKNSVENRPRKKVAQESEKGQSGGTRWVPDGYKAFARRNARGLRRGGEVNLPCRSLQDLALSQARVRDAAMVRRIQTLRAFRRPQHGGLEAQRLRG